MRQSKSLAMRVVTVAAALIAIPVVGGSCSSTQGGSSRDDTGAPTAYGTLSPTAPVETEHWGQLAGAWQCVVSTPAGGDSTTTSEATWTWRYVLDGHAVQDVYASRSSAFRGTGLRIYHPHRGEWEISWIANSQTTDSTSRVSQFTATSTRDEVVMRRANGDPTWRTVFHDIQRDRFSWYSEPSGQTMLCTRGSE